jgi:CysZ protein
MYAFLCGAGCPWRAIRLLVRQPALWRYVAIPVGLNLLVGVVLYATLLLAGFRFIAMLVEGWPAWIAWLLRGLLVITLFVTLGYVLVRFGVVLGAPFYSRLSELLEERLCGTAPASPPFTLTGIARDLGRAMAFELKKLLLALAIGLPILLLHLIPGAGSLLALLGGLALGATLACLDFFDPPLERRRLSFRAKLAFIRRHLPGSAGFGLVCLGLVSLPLLNLLTVPVCIAAGTIFFCEAAAEPPAK